MFAWLLGFEPFKYAATARSMINHRRLERHFNLMAATTDSLSAGSGRRADGKAYIVLGGCDGEEISRGQCLSAENKYVQFCTYFAGPRP